MIYKTSLNKKKRQHEDKVEKKKREKRWFHFAKVASCLKFVIHLEPWDQNEGGHCLYKSWKQSLRGCMNLKGWMDGWFFSLGWSLLQHMVVNCIQQVDAIFIP